MLDSIALPWGALCSPVLYHGLQPAADRLGVPAADVYDLVVTTLDHRREQRGAERAAEQARDAKLRLQLFHAVMGHAYQRELTAPPDWHEYLAVRRPLRDRGTAKPFATVVMLSYNRLVYLRNAIYALHRTLGDDECELIVVDNASSDGSVPFLERAAREGLVSRLVLASRNLGNAAGFNVGCHRADPAAQLLIKLDSDICPLSPGWIGRALAFDDAGGHTNLIGGYQWNHYALRGAPTTSVYDREVVSWSSWAVGSCLAIPRPIFEDLGFFSEPDGTYFWDDVDYWMRATRRGYGGFYPLDVVLFHQNALDATTYKPTLGAKTPDKVLATLRRYGREYDLRDRPLSVHPSRFAEPPSHDLVHRLESL